MGIRFFVPLVPQWSLRPYLWQGGGEDPPVLAAAHLDGKLAGNVAIEGPVNHGGRLLRLQPHLARIALELHLLVVVPRRHVARQVDVALCLGPHVVLGQPQVVPTQRAKSTPAAHQKRRDASQSVSGLLFPSLPPVFRTFPDKLTSLTEWREGEGEGEGGRS